jgi:hypothetical protein
LNSPLNWLGQRLARYLMAPAKHYKPTVVSGGEAHWSDYIEPCDVLLIEGASRISSAIKYLTQSTWSHAAVWVGDAAPAPLVEADVSAGVAAVPLEKYRDANVRICRPLGLTSDDRARLIDYLVGHIGDSYDVKNLFDLARYLIPTPPVPARFRQRLITLGSGEPTRAICSSLIAAAFAAVRYPILPVPVAAATVPTAHFRRRAPSSHVPRDFDLSPYFAVIKPTIEQRFDYQRFPWAEVD